MANQAPNGGQVSSSPFFKRAMHSAEEYVRKPLRVKQLLNDAYQKASEKKDVGTIAHEAWESLQRLFRLIRASVSGEYTGLPTPTIVAAVAVVIYFLSPIDLIPDFIPVLGLLDDVALVAWFTSTLTDEMDKFEAWESSRAVLVEGHSSVTGETPKQRAEATASTFEPSPESAKKAGTTDLPATPPVPSAESATSATDVTANTTDSSRVPNHDSQTPSGDTGGNIR